MEKNNKRTGIWIPIELIENKELDWANKALLTEINSLHKQDKGCIASDQHFANLLGLKNAATAKKRVDTLVELELIHREIVYKNRKIIGKILTPLNPKTNTEKIETNNPKGNQVGNTMSDSTSQKNNTPVPTEQKNSSSETSGVVLESQSSSSQKNIKNSLTNSNIFKHGPIQDIDEIVEHSSFLNKLFFDKPDAMDQFKKAYEEYSNEEKYSMSEVYDNMNYIFHDYSNWKDDLKNLGYNYFLLTTKQYHDGTPQVVAGIVASLIRILQHRTK